MKTLLSLCFGLSLLVGCASTPEPLSLISQDWILKPQNSDNEIARDDQFLKKAQDSQFETASTRRRPFLKP